MKFSAFTVLVVTVALGITSQLQAQSCRASDSTAAFIIAAVKSLETSSDANVVAERERSQIPAVSADSVVLVSDTTICSQMASVYSAGLSASAGTRSGIVYVVRAGSVYVVVDPAIHFGEYLYEMVIDHQGRILARGTL